MVSSVLKNVWRVQKKRYPVGIGYTVSAGSRYVRSGGPETQALACSKSAST